MRFYTFNCPALWCLLEASDHSHHFPVRNQVLSNLEQVNLILIPAPSQIKFCRADCSHCFLPSVQIGPDSDRTGAHY